MIDDRWLQWDNLTFNNNFITIDVLLDTAAGHLTFVRIQ